MALIPPLQVRSATRLEGTPYGWGPGYSVAGMPPDLTNAVAIGAGQNYTLALRRDGTVAAWGSGFSGALDVPAGLTQVVAISAGHYHALALRADGRIFGWGAIGHVQREAIIHPPEWLTNAVAIEAGYDHSLALTSDGFVIAWGANHLGALNVPLWLRQPLGLAAGQQFSLAILPDRSIFGWGINYENQLDFPAGLTNLLQVDASIFQHCLAIGSEGRVFAWGNNGHQQCQVPANLEAASQVSAGSLHSLALRPDGTVAAWGANGAPHAQPPPVSLRFFAVAAGHEHSVGLTRGPVVISEPQWLAADAGEDLRLEGGVACSLACAAEWRHDGNQLVGRTNLALNLANVQASDAGTYTLVASNEFGHMEGSPITLVVNPTPPRLTAQPQHAAVQVGDAVEFQVAARGSEPLRYQWQLEDVDLPAGTNATLHLDSVGFPDEGAYRVIVANDHGSATSQVARLSAGHPAFLAQPAGRMLLPGMDTEFVSETLSPEPLRFQWFRDGEPLPGEEGATLRLLRPDLALAGAYSVVASNSLGAVTSSVARLRFRAVPSPLPAPGIAFGWRASWSAGPLQAPDDLTNAVAVSVGQHHALALRADGSLTAWGNGFAPSGELDVPADLTGILAISAGAFHSLALLADGTVRGWGSTNLDFGQWTVPPGLDRVVEVAAGRAHSLALRDDGSVVSWPASAHLPDALTNVVSIATEENACLALRADGTVLLWRTDNPQSTRTFPPDPVGIESVAAARDYGLARRFDGTVLGLGDLAPPPPPELTNTVAVEAAVLHAVALRGDGTIAAWGADAGGNLSPPTPLAGVTALSANEYNNLAITRAPLITRAPADAWSLLGQELELEVAARSVSPLTYQWRRNGEDLPGATGPTLHLVSPGFADQGAYEVTLANAEHAVRSQPAIVSVFGQPVLALTRNDSGARVLEVRGPARHPWRIEASADLRDWREVESFPSTDGFVAWPLPSPEAPGAHFYRVLVP